jgi:plastocyanin
MLALAAGLLALSGCGSSSSTTSSSASTPVTTASPATSSTASPKAPAGPAAGQALSLAANSEGELKYNTKTLSAKAGNVSIDFTNMAPLAHNVTVESSSGKVLGATPTFQGGSKTLSLNLKAGTYKFFCSVPGHRMAGMEGTLTVN